MSRDVETIIAERTGVLGFAREQGRQIDGLVAMRKLTVEEGSMLKRFLSGFADGIATGLHRDGNDPEGVRALMRTNVTGNAHG